MGRLETYLVVAYFKRAALPLMLLAWVSQTGCEDAEEAGGDTGPSPDSDAGDDGSDEDTDDTGTGEFPDSEDTGEEIPPLEENEWMLIEGGTFMMGSPEGEGLEDEWPQHPVDIPTFRMLKTEVTTVHYEQCVAAGACTPNGLQSFCNHSEELPDHPVTCVDWFQATDFCEWIGGRLPTEAEWEYAARSGGRDILYPWGDEEATCDLAVTDGESGTDRGCGLGTTWPVCSKPLGNSDQGLCDLAGNVYEWVEDWYHPAYRIEEDGGVYDAPDDGSAWIDPVVYPYKILRGGGISSSDDFRAAFRQFHEPEFMYGGLGIRCVV